MSTLSEAIDNLVTANRILAHENVVDAYGHISMRHPDDPGRYFLACSRSPELVEPGDILEFSLDSQCIDDKGMNLYIERPIHGSIYAVRPEIMSVVHNHSYAVIPFSVSKAPLRPIAHVAARIGHSVPVWDIHDNFGDTDLLVSTNEQGGDLARAMGEGRVILMRGHGATVAGLSIEDAVMTSVFLQVNAQLQIDALRLGEVTYLHPGEVDIRLARSQDFVGNSRAWEYMSRRAGC
ncbi:MAG: class II aldolase/adducin family protein [Alphaproteobacteria bacterium]|nr:class II aldolase/adducin family protein [Rhodospirillales bacterium]MDP6645078.1 class II aldolase/adducin family protein [Rhodospirillales bacterium]MDP6819409.1 class II aldolase/adducin family protein [Alphaproteobacteria bacterium]